MTNTLAQPYTGPVTSLDDDLQTSLGSLMTQLSSSYDGRPIDSHELELAIESPLQEQFVAIRDGKVIGAASVSILPVSYSEAFEYSKVPTAWLASFIVDESYRGRQPNESQSIASQLWDLVLSWAKDHSLLSLEFMTEFERGAAVQFYKNKHAEEVGVAGLFNLPLPENGPIKDARPSGDAGVIYETCKTHVSLHLYDGKVPLSTDEISSHTQDARKHGISLVQYIAPLGSPAANMLLDQDIQLRREEMIMRVSL